MGSPLKRFINNPNWEILKLSKFNRILIKIIYFDILNKYNSFIVTVYYCY